MSPLIASTSTVGREGRDDMNRYQTALSALQFFAMSAEEQIESARAGATGDEPKFFSGYTGADRDCNYFMGVACIFKTYQGELFERIASDDGQDALSDFVHRLNVDMYSHRNPSDWSGGAVRAGQMWAKLREDARKALILLSESIPLELPKFDVSALINVNDFLPSQEAKRLLQE